MPGWATARQKHPAEQSVCSQQAAIGAPQPARRPAPAQAAAAALQLRRLRCTAPAWAPTREAAKAVAQVPTSTGRYLQEGGEISRKGRQQAGPRVRQQQTAAHVGRQLAHSRKCLPAQHLRPVSATPTTRLPPAPPAAGALVGHGPQHRQVAQACQQQAQVQGAARVVAQPIGIRLLLWGGGRVQPREWETRQLQATPPQMQAGSGAVPKGSGGGSAGGRWQGRQAVHDSTQLPMSLSRALASPQACLERIRHGRQQSEQGAAHVAPQEHCGGEAGGEEVQAGLGACGSDERAPWAVRRWWKRLGQPSRRRLAQLPACPSASRLASGLPVARCWQDMKQQDIRQLCPPKIPSSRLADCHRASATAGRAAAVPRGKERNGRQLSKNSGAQKGGRQPLLAFLRPSCAALVDNSWCTLHRSNPRAPWHLKRPTA